MRFHRKLITTLALCLAFTSSSFASESSEKAAELFDQGLAVLSKGDFDGAVKAFAGAAKSDPANQSYKQHLALVHRVKQVRGMLEKAEDPAMWGQAAQSLRSFYYDYEVYGEALALDQQRYEKLGTPAVAVDLAESQLELGKNEASVKLLSGLDPAKCTPRSDILLGIGLARLGKLDQAKALATKSAGTKDMALILDAACLNALVGNRQLAAQQLTLAFEQTPPAQLDKAKAYAKNRQDLASLRAAEYAMVWTVASKVKAGGCSGETAGCGSGAGCGGCSKAGASGGCDMGEGDSDCDGGTDS